jgi:replication-associated recombination protein RarA
MSKKKDIVKGQLNLMGKKVKPEEQPIDDDTYIRISALQKYVRRGMVDRAMHNAYKLSDQKNGWHLWRRLNVIAVEDVLDATIILAVSELSRQAARYGYESWDGRRCAVAAAKMLAEAQKDRSADEFLEMEDFLEKHVDDEEVQKKLDELGKMEDYVFDQHTRQGQRMGRVGFAGERFWHEESGVVLNPSSRYVRYGDWVWENMQRIYYGKKNRGEEQ